VPLNELQRNHKWINEDGTPTDAFAEVIEDLIQEFENMKTNTQLFNIRPAGTSPVAQYTAPEQTQGSRGTVVTKFSARGTGTYNVYVGAAASVSTLIMSSVALVADGTTPSTLIDQLVLAGESIWLEPSAGDAIVFLGSGTELT